jgi:hypothetical protein
MNDQNLPEDVTMEFEVLFQVKRREAASAHVRQFSNEDAE